MSGVASKAKYLFLDQDPVLDSFRYAVERSGMSYAEIAEKSNGQVSAHTLYCWDVGSTKHPQHRTLNAAMAAMGFDEVWRSKEYTLKTQYDEDKKSDHRFVVRNLKNDY